MSPEDGPTGYEPLTGRLSGEVELPDGEVVEIPRPDRVFPTVGEQLASVDVYIEEGRFRVREEGACALRLGVANNDIEDPDGAVATLHAGVSKGEEDVYAEVAFDTTDELRHLRDSLNLALRYRGEEP